MKLYSTVVVLIGNSLNFRYDSDQLNQNSFYRKIPTDFIYNYKYSNFVVYSNYKKKCVI